MAQWSRIMEQEYRVSQLLNKINHCLASQILLNEIKSLNEKFQVFLVSEWQ